MKAIKKANTTINGRRYILIGRRMFDYIHAHMDVTPKATFQGSDWYVDPDTLCHCAKALLGSKYIRNMLTVDFTYQ